MEIQISVRNLVEFILRDGDIDNRHKAATDTAMQEGSRIHRMLQKRMGPEYEAEVSLRHIRDCGDYRIIVDGRADGVIREDGRVVIDEIKGTYRDIHKMEAPENVHLAQAKCYAYIVSKEEGLAEIGIRMTYCNMDTEEVRYFHDNFTFLTLKNWFEQLMLAYQKWADFEYEWKLKRKDSIKELQFPFSYREGQKELAGHVYQTICHQKKLFIQAPTGVGKTISTVFPSVKAIGEEKADKIFYLTAKTITRTVAEDTFSILQGKGLCFKVVTLTAKEKICKMDKAQCDPDYCPYAKGHFGRINDAIFDLLQNEDSFDRETIDRYAECHTVCPFEMSLDMSLFSDAVICDYNYLFDPYVRLKRFFTEGVRGPYLFLVDEAHNLVERGRDMYSSELVKEDFLELKRTVAPHGTKLERYIDKCNRQLLAIKKETEHLRVLESAGALDLELARLHSAIGSYLEDHEDCPVRDEILEFYFVLSRYLDVNEKLDENYVTYAMLRADGSFLVKQFCVNPAKRLKECMQQGVATVLFSATFLPIQYHKQLLGGGEEDFEVYARSSFAPEQMKLLIGKDVTSRYTRRSELEYYNIAAYINAVVKQKRGNYMIFCPSHAFLEEIYGVYESYFYEPASESLLMQSQYMTEEQRELFLGCFRKIENASEQRDALSADKSVLGFCVLGGIFAEGIDLTGESLIGAVVVGTGLPQVCEERELLKRFFDDDGRDGFDYAYRFPGMNKVLQAAGRVIRSASDQGVVALLDERFLQRSYLKLFPREWENYLPVTVQQCAEEINSFWNADK